MGIKVERSLVRGHRRKERIPNAQEDRSGGEPAENQELLCKLSSISIYVYIGALQIEASREDQGEDDKG
jgi:hypothetical protein